ncbi:hypothetical protein GCM10010300_24830 [Streptomyces olivaceoviridis]|nr:hypothetical protein GCM10010300_24830 [Streptomyces olivaceoviridis]
MCSRPGPGRTDAVRRPPGNDVTVTWSPVISRTVVERAPASDAGRATVPLVAVRATAVVGTTPASSINPVDITAMGRNFAIGETPFEQP